MSTLVNESNLPSIEQGVVILFRRDIDGRLYYKDSDGDSYPVVTEDGKIYKIENIEKLLNVKKISNWSGENIRIITQRAQEIIFEFLTGTVVVGSGGRGPRGLQGAQGIQGEKGDTGDKGEDGLDGADMAAEKNTQTLDYDGEGNLIYQGEAEAGSAKSSPVWAIKKFTYDGNGALIDVQWANGSTDKVNIWDDRASLTYS